MFCAKFQLVRRLVKVCPIGKHNRACGNRFRGMRILSPLHGFDVSGDSVLGLTSQSTILAAATRLEILSTLEVPKFLRQPLLVAAAWLFPGFQYCSFLQFLAARKTLQNKAGAAY